MRLSTTRLHTFVLLSAGAAASFVLTGALTGCGIAKQALQNAANRLAHNGRAGGKVDASQLVEGVDDSGADLTGRIQNDTPLDQLTPWSTGPGVVVCAPVALNSDTTLSAGIGGWLNLAVSGQPEFEKSTAIGNIRRAMREMGRGDLELSAHNAAQLAGMLGVTDAAVGTLSGSPSRCTLSYRLYSIPDDKPIGAPITVTGPEPQIVSELPAIARHLVTALGGSPTPVWKSVGLTRDDLAFVGKMDAMNNTMRFTPADETRLAALAPKSPYAAVIDVDYASQLNEQEARNAIASLMTQTPDNSVVLSSIASDDVDAIVPYAQQIKTTYAAYPHNYEIAWTAVYIGRVTGDPTLERKAAEATVRCSPRSPDAWLTLAWTISNEANQVRKSRFYGEMSSSERNFIRQLYPDWFACAKHSVDLDPRFGKAWERVAEAGTFAGQTDIANAAEWKALRLDPDKKEVLSWGLQMYQDKWGGDPRKLATIANIAAKSTFATANEVTSIADDLTGAGFGQQASQLVRNSISNLQDMARRNPKDGEPHWGMATLYRYSGQTNQALAEYTTAENLIPNSAALHYAIGDLYDQNQSQQSLQMAIDEYQKALAIDPDNACLYDLGFDLKTLGQISEADQDLTRCVQLYPNKAEAHYALGEVYEIEKQIGPATDQYREAVRLSPYFKEANEHLIVLLDETGQYDEALKVGKIALSYYPKDSMNIDNLADVYLNKKQWALSERLSRYAISVNSSDALAHENLGEALVQEGDRSEARQEWNTVLSLNDPSVTPQARKMLAQYP